MTRTSSRRPSIRSWEVGFMAASWSALRPAEATMWERKASCAAAADEETQANRDSIHAEPKASELRQPLPRQPEQNSMGLIGI